MSQETNSLDPAAAYQHIFDRVHANVIFTKLAGYGIQPSSDEEAMALLNIGQRLNQIEPAVKQAQAKNSPLVAISNHLDQITGQFAQSPGQKQAAEQNETAEAYQLAVNMMQDPTIFNSVLTLKTAEAVQYEEAYKAQVAAN